MRIANEEKEEKMRIANEEKQRLEAEKQVRLKA